MGDLLMLGLGLAAFIAAFSGGVVWCAGGKPLLDPEGER